MSLDMRDAFFDELYDIACKDKQVMLLTADMSAHSIERFKTDLPNQFINTGISEQNTISVAAGLALNGKKVFVYSIIPFITMRCYEQIKVDLCCMNLPVTIVGVGAGFSYAGDGPTHYGVQDMAIMRILPNIKILNPSDALLANRCAKIAYESDTPVYVRIDKERMSIIHIDDENYSTGYCIFDKGKDLTIITTGIMMHKALEVLSNLKEQGILASVIELYQIKPITNEFIKKVLNSKYIVTIEENNLTGGLGSLISEVITDASYNIPLKRLAIDDVECFKVGSRDELHKFFKLDVDTMTERIIKFLKETELCY